jgi:hypothetical protein
VIYFAAASSEKRTLQGHCFGYSESLPGDLVGHFCCMDASPRADAARDGASVLARISAESPKHPYFTLWRDGQSPALDKTKDF